MRGFWWLTRQRFWRPWQSGAGFDVDLTDRATGYVEMLVSGPQEAIRRIEQEAGGHRWQRVPPTERKGRVQTSTVTVAVLRVPGGTAEGLKPSELHWETMRGSGAGGQHRNVTNSAVRVRHLPTGMEAYCCSSKSQHQNKASAFQILAARVNGQRQSQGKTLTARVRNAQIGSGQRGDKIRTYRVRDDLVCDHRTGERFKLSKVRTGEFS